MNYYPLLEIPGFEAEVQLANFPCNDDYRQDIRPVSVCAAQTTGVEWRFIDCGVLAPGEIGTFSRSSLKAADLQDSAIYFFMTEEPMPKTLGRLPNPNTFQVTQPAWRGNLRVIGNGTTTSYSGEYPDHLASLEKSTLLSLSPMIQQGPDLINFILAVNLTLSPEKKALPAKLIRLEDRTVVDSFQLTTNSINPLEIDTRNIKEGEPVALTCSGMTGIPIFVTSNAEKTMISMEHTHPPAEMTVFGPQTDRMAIVRHSKHHFLNG